MKKNYVFVLMAASVIGGLAFTKMSKEVEIAKYAKEKSHINANGAPTGKTGAPGESTCTQCHSGTVQNGTGFNNVMLLDQDNIMVTEYTPGETYDVLVTMNTPQAKNGFQATARILSNNTTAGTMTSVAGSTQLQSPAGGKRYVTHTNSSNTSQTGWAFTWVAPSTDVGDVVFYVATNATNSNNTASGDIIRTSLHTYTAVDNAGIKKEEAKAPFTASFNAAKNTINLGLNAKQGSVYSLNLVDLTGKSVMFKRFSNLEGESKEEIYLPENVKGGMYILHFFEDNNSFAKQIYIAK
ncbi:MAG: hypothetical protein K0R65_917 [Crocinitomicaceae bacterium]|jgi:hypothetical protein|nr:hypothetical protein [Crocinitomicaceae bacterium]